MRPLEAKGEGYSGRLSQHSEPTQAVPRTITQKIARGGNTHVHSLGDKTREDSEAGDQVNPRRIQRHRRLIRGSGRTRERNAPLIAAMVCLFAFSADAFGLYYLYLAAAAFLIILAGRYEILSIPVDFNLIMLLFFAGSYATASFGHPGQLALNFLFPVGYLVGFFVVNTGGDHNVQLRRLVLTLVAGMTTHGTLNAVTNLRAYGFNPGVRMLPDFWTNAPLTATLQATLFIPLVGFAYYGVAMRQQNRALVGAITALGLLVAGVYNLATASRTIFVVAAITLSISVLASLWLLPRRRLLRSIGVAGTVATATVIYSLGTLHLRSIVDQSVLLDRLANQETTTLGEDPRFERWRYVLDHFFEYPAGGLNFRARIGYAHNLWLDAYDTAGLVPFLALGGFTLGALVLLWRVVRLRSVTGELRVLLIGLWVAFLAQFMTEPILDGAPALLVVFCVVAGGASALGGEAVAHESPVSI